MARSGPIYAKIDDPAGVSSAGIWDVLHEFNAQLGREYFTEQPSAELLAFVFLPSGATLQTGVVAVAVDKYMIEFHPQAAILHDMADHNIVVHELGHAVAGLGHSTDPGNIMWPDPAAVQVSLHDAVEQVIDAGGL